MTVIRQHERRPAPKPPAYVETHMALIQRRADRIAFAERHGIPLVTTDDPRLAGPLPDPVPGGRSLDTVIANLRALAKAAAKIGRD